MKQPSNCHCRDYLSQNPPDDRPDSKSGNKPGPSPDESQNEETFASKLYFGHVSHRRMITPHHQFKYKVFFALFNLDDLEALDKRSVFFNVNRWGPLSFRTGDHGARDGTELKTWIAEKLAEGGYDFPLGTVMLQCFPRIWGFAFNPVSIWYCYDTKGILRSVLYEVRNTFREWRGYLLPVANKAPPGNRVRHACAKTFYVSPLIDMDCMYHFTLRAPDDRISIHIRETRKGEDVLSAHQTGVAKAFTTQSILRALLRHPFLYLKIVLGIHKEAVMTLMKGAKFFANPRGPTGDVTYPMKNDHQEK